MENKKRSFSGIIPTDEYNIVFSCKDNVFEFYKPACQRNISDVFKRSTIRADEDGYIKGYLYDGRKIAIDTSGNELNILYEYSVTTSFYFVTTGVSEDNEDFKFKILKFKGGILNKLYTRQSICAEFKKEGAYFKYNDDDGFDISIVIDGINCKLSVWSSYIISTSGIFNDDAMLTVEFDECVDLKCFNKVFFAIMGMCQFMAFRCNVEFQKIELLRPHKQNDEDILPFAECCVYYGDSIETSRPEYGMLKFELLKDRTKALFDLMFMRYSSSNVFYGSFIPENDQRVLFVSSAKMREVCSAIECEIENSKHFKTKSSEELKKLIDEIKDRVNDHKLNKRTLPPKTYDLIFGSIRNWNNSLDDRIWMAYERYNKCVSTAIRRFSFRLEREDLRKFVKYRNTLTHGNEEAVTAEIARITYAITVITCCCFMERIGLSIDEIFALMEAQFVS